MAPNLLTLQVLSHQALPLPVLALMDGQICWDSMQSLELQGLGNMRLCNLFSSTWHFPQHLTKLSITSTPIPLPLMCRNFNSLSRLQVLELSGVKFQGAFLPGSFQLHALTHVTLGRLHISSSDYSFPAQQIGLRCLRLKSLTLIGQLPNPGSTTSSSALLVRQYLRATCRFTLPQLTLEAGRPGAFCRLKHLWVNIPLLIADSQWPYPPSDQVELKLIRG